MKGASDPRSLDCFESRKANSAVSSVDSPLQAGSSFGLNFGGKPDEGQKHRLRLTFFRRIERTVSDNLALYVRSSDMDTVFQISRYLERFD